MGLEDNWREGGVLLPIDKKAILVGMVGMVGKVIRLVALYQNVTDVPLGQHWLSRQETQNHWTNFMKI